MMCVCSCEIVSEVLSLCYGVLIGVLTCFFFFKQKTAYEMRISDWSSDVCSSDLDAAGNLVNSNFVNGIDTFNPVPGGCTNDNFYISAANGRCVYDFNATAADEASYGNKAFFLNGEVQINDDWSTYLDRKSTRLNSSR